MKKVMLFTMMLFAGMAGLTNDFAWAADDGYAVKINNDWALVVDAINVGGYLTGEVGAQALSTGSGTTSAWGMGFQSGVVGITNASAGACYGGYFVAGDQFGVYGTGQYGGYFSGQYGVEASGSMKGGNFESENGSGVFGQGPTIGIETVADAGTALHGKGGVGSSTGGIGGYFAGKSDSDVALEVGSGRLDIPSEWIEVTPTISNYGRINPDPELQKQWVVIDTPIFTVKNTSTEKVIKKIYSHLIRPSSVIIFLNHQSALGSGAIRPSEHVAGLMAIELYSGDVITCWVVN